MKCGYKNKVEMLEPAGGTPQNTNAGDDTAFAEAKFEPFEKHGTKFCELGLTTPPPRRPLARKAGRIRLSPASAARRARTGTASNASAHAATPPKECEPGPNETRNAQGRIRVRVGLRA